MERTLPILILVVLAVLVVPAVADEVDNLILDLKYGSDDVRKDAVVALGESGDPRAVDPLIDALNDWVVREVAARALGKIGDPKAVDPLIETLPSGGMASYEAIKALGDISDPRAVDTLIGVL